jgi:hypothetical protein
MVVLPLSKLPSDYDADMNSREPIPAPQPDSVNWLRIAAAATIVAGGALLFSGRRRAGLAVAATGTALALIDQQDVLSDWWAVLPGCIVDIQELLSQAEGAVEEFAVQREKLGNVLGR